MEARIRGADADRCISIEILKIYQNDFLHRQKEPFHDYSLILFLDLLFVLQKKESPKIDTPEPRSSSSLVWSPPRLVIIDTLPC